MKFSTLTTLASVLIGFMAGNLASADPTPWTTRALTQVEKDHMLNVSWKPNCPVARDHLRVVTLEHVDFHGQVRVGSLVVHQAITAQVIQIFKKLRSISFPIDRITNIEEFGGEDLKAQKANATTAFNCREVAGKPGVFSKHSYGLAMDINPVLNPYKAPEGWEPNEDHIDRSRREPGMLFSDETPVKTFEALGWRWGGRWANETDYQHFDRKLSL